MSGSGTRTEFDFPEFETQLTRDDEDLIIERKPSAELDASDEYAELERQLTELRDQLDETVEDFDTTAFHAVLRDLIDTSPTEPTSPDTQNP